MEIPSQNFIFQPLDPVGTVSPANARSGSSPSGQSQIEQDVASLTFGQMLSGDGIRSDRVQVLRSQIASGAYQVSAQDVASRLLNNMTEQL